MASDRRDAHLVIEYVGWRLRLSLPLLCLMIVGLVVQPGTVGVALFVVGVALLTFVTSRFARARAANREFLRNVREP